MTIDNNKYSEILKNFDSYFLTLDNSFMQRLDGKNNEAAEDIILAKVNEFSKGRGVSYIARDYQWSDYITTPNQNQYTLPLSKRVVEEVKIS